MQRDLDHRICFSIGQCDRADDKWHTGSLHTGEFVQVVATRIQMVISVRLGEWAWLEMLLHSGAVVRLRSCAVAWFTEHQTLWFIDIETHGEYQ